MDRDLRQDVWQSNELLNKIRTRDDYAQNVYAAMCNMRWQPLDVFPILKDEHWSCSWRCAGGLVAEWQGKGDYMNWYCSGMGGVGGYDDPEEQTVSEGLTKSKYVPEGTVTDEIREDFAKLGWSPREWSKDKD